MGDHTNQQRIHPVDVEAQPKPTAPLVSGEFTKSENGDPEQQQYPPQQRMLPVRHSRPPKRRRGSCCRCICCVVFALVALVIAVGATIGILWLIFHPKIPKYSIDTLRVSNFTIDNLTVHATFDVNVTTRNPNKKIGIYYKGGSYLGVTYSGQTLCNGTFPVFYQGHGNTTKLTVVLTGEQQMGSSIMSALQQQQQTGAVPLQFHGTVPVKIKFGALKLWKMKFGVNCDLTVNSLTTNNQISLRNSHCKFKLKKLFA